MEQAYKIEELKSKVKAGIPLTDGEFNALSEHRNIQAAMNRPAFDFAEVESVLHGGNIERQAIIDQAKRFADMNPHKRGGGYIDTGFGGGLIPLMSANPLKPTDRLQSFFRRTAVQSAVQSSGCSINFGQDLRRSARPEGWHHEHR